MTPRERVLNAVQFKDSDIVPYQVNLTIGARENLARFYDNLDFEAEIGNHLASLSHRRTVPQEEVQPGWFKDEWGVVWNRTVDRDIGVVENRVLDRPSLDGWAAPEPVLPGLKDAYGSFTANNADRFRIGSMGFSLFERAWALRGMDMLMVDMLDSPEFVHDLLDAITEYDLAQIGYALTQDIDCVYLGDDWGSQSGLIMGPSLWREFIRPRVERLYRRIHEGGKFVMIHSCGDVNAILPDLAELGVNVFNPFQPETLDVYKVKRDYYGEMAFYGGISVQHLLPYGTPEEVTAETKKMLRELGPGGGYIASPSHHVPSDVPAENLAAMIEVLRGQ